MELSKVYEGSIKPEYVCTICKRELWTKRSPETNGQEWLITLDGTRHYRGRCNLPPKPKGK